MRSKDSPKEAELSVKLTLDGKEEEKPIEEQKEPTKITIIRSQEISRQENKEVPAGRRIEVLKVRKDGFLQSLVVAWNGASTVPDTNIQLDLGKQGAFNVDFEEYYESGLDVNHSAQDFWVSKRDDTNKKYAIAMTPAIPIEFNGLRIIITNKNTTTLTVSLAQLKYFRVIEQKS